MKRLTLIIFAILFSFTSFSQAKRSKNKVKNHTGMYKMHKANPNGVMMQNGRMVMIIKGQTSFLDNEVTMSNGTRVFSNGNYITKKGNTMLMTEGQHMNLGGNMLPMKTHKMKK